MARQKSDEKRAALMAAATRVIVAQGLSVPTAVIAQEAGVSNGSLFNYFETKADLYNQLYLELKTEMATAALKDLPTAAPIRQQFFQIWSNWGKWAMKDPSRRRALTQLGVADEITPATRESGHKVMVPIAEILQRIRADGPLRDAPMPFVVALLNSLADTTMDFMLNEPANADKHCEVGFDALWRVIA